MTKFVGNFTNKIDAKGRLSVPASFREGVVGQTFSGIVCFPSFVEDVLEGGGLDYLDELQAMIDGLQPYSPEREAFETSVLGEIRRLPFDGDGRVILPPEFIEFAKLEGRATFVGRGRKFKIMNTDAFEAERAAARAVAHENRALLAGVRFKGAAE